MFGFVEPVPERDELGIFVVASYLSEACRSGLVQVQHPVRGGFR